MTLPEGFEPLRLADGRTVDPVTGEVSRLLSTELVEKQKLIEVPRNADLKLRQAQIQRRLADLPLPVDKMHGLSVILCYKLFGLSEEDISVAVGLPLQQIQTILMSDALTTLQKAVVENVKTADMDDIRAAIHRTAQKAVVVADTILEEGSEGARVAIIKDVLDRDGYRPVDVIEHRMKMEGGLRIEIVKKTETPDVVMDVSFNNVIDVEGETNEP